MAFSTAVLEKLSYEHSDFSETGQVLVVAGTRTSPTNSNDITVNPTSNGARTAGSVQDAARITHSVTGKGFRIRSVP